MSDTLLRTYDPTTVHLIVGIFPVGGFADGVAITAKRNADTFKMVNGINGAVSRKRSFNKSGEISFSLAQTSMSNIALSTLALADEYTGAGVVPLVIWDSATQSIVLSAYGWLRKPPEVSYGKELTNRQWIFDAADIDIFVSGNLSDS